MAKKKKDKEKIIYYDDNSTIVDMSAVSRRGEKKYSQQPQMFSSFGEKFKTFWNAMKMMFMPMLVVLMALCGLYLLLMLLSGNLF
jgi:hypothetical protein